MKKLLSILIACCSFITIIHAQEITLRGKVTNSGGAPMEGVNVTAYAGNSKLSAVITNSAGEYVLRAPSGVTDLEFSYIGMKTILEPISNRQSIFPNVT